MADQGRGRTTFQVQIREVSSFRLPDTLQKSGPGIIHRQGWAASSDMDAARWLQLVGETYQAKVAPKYPPCRISVPLVS